MRKIKRKLGVNYTELTIVHGARVKNGAGIETATEKFTEFERERNPMHVREDRQENWKRFVHL